MTPFDAARTTVDGQPVSLVDYPFVVVPPPRWDTSEAFTDALQRDLAPEYAVGDASIGAGGNVVVKVLARSADDDLIDERTLAPEGAEPREQPRFQRFLQRIAPFCAAGTVTWASDVSMTGHQRTERHPGSGLQLVAHGWSSRYASVHLRASREHLAPWGETADPRPQSWSISCSESPGDVISEGVRAAAPLAAQPLAEPFVAFGRRNLRLTESVSQQRVRKEVRRFECPAIILRTCTDADRDAWARCELMGGPGCRNHPDCTYSPECVPGQQAYLTTVAVAGPASTSKATVRAPKPGDLTATFLWTGECRDGAMRRRGVVRFELIPRAPAETVKKLDAHTDLVTHRSLVMAPASFDLLTGERVELTNPPLPLNETCPKT
ncbi:MAG: hypothetical protein HOO96_24220 [Polyangiaceae bacterium]|nr:hypothetical protein [Polyangiaceae bacterium]